MIMESTAKKSPVLTMADGFPFDIIRMLEGRGLATASSGGGKSWLLRRIIEQVLAHAPEVQVMVIDPEGEFHTLREKFDLLVCAPADADAVATPATAPILVRHLLEAGTSAVFNIYDLKAYERQAFVRAFCEAMVNAPRSLWRSVLVVIDEAHIFCPEGARSESGQAVIDLATRGRKRGFGLLLATQRLAKLHKDAAGEMLNKFIGRTSLINDIKRAADELGETQKEMSVKLKSLDRGEWFAYGPALPEGVSRLKVGAIVTTHPQPGARLLERPIAPSPKIRALLEEKLKDLPRQAAQEASTIDQLKAQLEESREAVRRLTKQQGQGGITEAQVKVRIHKAVQIAEQVAFDKGAESSLGSARMLRERLEGMRWDIDQILAAIPGPKIPSQEVPREAIDDNTPGKSFFLKTSTDKMRHDFDAPYPELEAIGITPAPEPAIRKEGLSAPQQCILDALAALMGCGVEKPTRVVVAVQVGASANSSGFQNNLGTLRSMGLIEYPGPGLVQMTGSGALTANMPKRALTLLEFHALWMKMISGPQCEILGILIKTYPRTFLREGLANAIGVSPNSSGFQNNLGTLRSMGAIEYPERGSVKASALLFPKGLK